MAAAGFPSPEVAPLAGDVSPRRYARVRSGGASAILAIYPEEIRATLPRFVRTTGLLEEAGVRVPRIRAADEAAGWMLLEDLGPENLSDRKARPWSELAESFRSGFEAARRIASLPREGLAPLGNPPLDGELLRRELAQTWDLYLIPEGLAGDGGHRERIAGLFDHLCRRLGEQPVAVCHRDFMARNLIPLPGAAAEVAVIDHQDLRLGPAAYDLASLLNDTLFPPPELEEELLARSPEIGREDYHRAAAQRTLKAIGTYSSFARRGSGRHLPLIPATLRHALRHLERLPEAEGLTAALAALWRPVLTR